MTTEHLPQAPASPKGQALPHVAISLTVAPSLCFAMEQAGVPLLRGLSLQHLGGAPCEALQLKLRLAPDLGPEITVALGPLAPGESLRRGALDYRLPVGALRAVQEREQAEVLWSLWEGEQGPLAEGSSAVEVLPFHHWPGNKGPAELLACFVHPNHPVVTGLLGQAREALAASTGSPAFDGYQSGDPGRALAMARAAYGVIQGLGATYAEGPPSFESAGQKVRLPEEVQSGGLACCLDLSLLAAACLEAMGLGALVVVVQGHAFPALWLVDEGFPEGLVEDAARLRTALALGQLVAFDSSAMVSQPPISFPQAQAIAEKHLQDDARFRHAIDLRRARLAGFRPMPLRPLGEQPLAEGAGGPLPEEAAPRVVVVPGPSPEAPAAPAPLRAPSAQVPPEVAARFDRWQERLLDLSLRNKLLAFRPSVGAAVPFEVPDLALLEDLLSAGESFGLMPAAVVAGPDPRDADLAAARSPEAERQALLLEALAKRQLHAGVGGALLPKNLKQLDRSARSSLEEGGAHTLYLALGLLKWYEGPASTSPRLAPLLLVPVALELDRVRLQWRLKRVAEDAVPNVTLVEKLRRDFGLDASALATPAADDSGVDLAAVLRGAREAVSRMPRWEVLPEAHLGLFSFTKFLMWKDLQDQREALLANPVVRHLASRTPGPFPQPTEAVAPESLDRSAHLPCVVDADGSQLAAVASALAGRSFVLQGPPGTGKSQTITTLIGAALAEGKRVLFVSEKLAALDVVHRRLEAVGLGDFCLELHSHQAEKKAVVASLMRAYERSPVGEDENHQEAMAELEARRDQLNAVSHALHQRRPLGFSLAQVLDRLVALRGGVEARLPVAGLGPDTPAGQLRAMREAVEALATRGARVAPASDQPWLGTRPPAWTAQGQEALADSLAEAERAAAGGHLAAEGLATVLGPAGPKAEALACGAALEAASALAEALAGGALPAAALGPHWAQAGARARAFLHAEGVAEREALALLQRWKPAFLDADRPAELALARRRSEAGLLGGLFLDLLGGWPGVLKALAEGTLPPAAQVVADLEALARLRAERARLAGEAAWVGGELGLAPQALLEALSRAEAASVASARLAALGAWGPGAEGPAEAAGRLALAGSSPEGAARLAAAARKGREALQALQSVEASLRQALGLESGEAWPAPELVGHFSGLAEKAKLWASALPGYRAWAGYAEATRGMEALGLGAWAEAHRRGELEAGQLALAFERRALGLWASGVRDAERSLAAFEAEAHESLALRFRKLDQEATALARRFVAAKLEARLPRREGLAPEGSEAGILLREARKKARHLPVRRLLMAMPNLLARLKPCALMSPLSIAQYLPPSGPRFDLVVFDEASQIGTHDAIGAIARGGQVVIVGDSKQLPPTSFFQRGADEDEPQDENDVEELESVLEEALAQQLPQQSLAWHYRSRHEALIDFSNRHYYDTKLQVFPAAQRHDPALGLHWHPVANAPYEAGSTRTNPGEARALVAHLVAAMEANPPGSLSFGVVTFGMTQQGLVLDLLEEARSARPAIEGHFQGPDRVFVKNLENVQGDERDVIYFSIGYAPDEAGRLRMHFGPLSQSGGERRLNVAITRARRRLHVFSALKPEDIDLARTTAIGAEHLKAFLLHAAHSGGEDSLAADRLREAPSALGRELKAQLEAEGHEVHAEVGCGSFRMGLAVARAGGGGYALGVELEGHGMATARDRERLRPQVLEGLGWRLHRVHPLEAWADPEGELQRLKQALSEALAAPPPAPPQAPSGAQAPWTPSEGAPHRPPSESLPAWAAEAGASYDGEAEEDDPEEEAAPAVEAPPADPDGPRPYRSSPLGALGEGDAFYEPLLASARQKALAQLLAQEGPIASDWAARRLMEAFGLKRLTDKAKRQALAEVDSMAARGALRLEGDFLWPLDLDPLAWRGFRVPPPGSSAREAAQVPPQEWAAAMAWVLAQAVAIEREALLKEAHRQLGLGSWGSKAEAPAEAGLAWLLAHGQAQAQGSQIRHLG